MPNVAPADRIAGPVTGEVEHTTVLEYVDEALTVVSRFLLAGAPSVAIAAPLRDTTNAMKAPDGSC